jgi:transposase
VVTGWLRVSVRKGQQPPWVVSDELWGRIEPLLPVVPRRADHPGRRRLDDRKVLCGILFVLPYDNAVRKALAERWQAKRAGR